MKLTPSLDMISVLPTKKSLFDFVQMLGKMWHNLSQVINGQLSFGDGTTADNINGVWITATTPVAPNTDFTLTHNMNRVPVGYLVMAKNMAADIYTGSVAATNTQITLRSTTANALIKLFILLLILSVAPLSYAQTNTAVSGTITDASGQTWNNGSITFTFNQNGTYPPYKNDGVNYTPVPISAPLNATGSFSGVPVPDNGHIVPAGTKWNIQVCPAATSPCYSLPSAITITGATMNISAQVIPPAIFISPTLGAQTYQDTQVNAIKEGSLYYRLTTQTYRYCTVVTGGVCTTWVTLNSAQAGTLANRPVCNASNGGAIYVATDLTPAVMYYCDPVNGWIISGSTVPTLPNTNLAFTATPTFPAGVNQSYTMTLTGNVTSSTTSGTPQNGTLLGFTLIQDATGGRTFSFPPSFILPVGYQFDTGTNHTNALTFRYDGTNWNLISNAGSGGGTPVGNNGDLQMKNGLSLAASGLNDNGTTVTVNRDEQNYGPNPWNDVRYWGARMETEASVQITTGSITSGTTTLTIAANWTGVNGDGIVIRGAGGNTNLATPGAGPTVTAVNAWDMISTGRVVANSSGATAYQYQFVPIGRNGQDYAAASPVTAIANGPATLGATTVNIASWTASARTITYNTASPHNLVVNSLVHIKTIALADAWYRVASVPSNTSFTVFSGNDTRLGAGSAGGAVGSVTWWQGNHIVIPHQANAFKYAVYGRTAGSMVFLGYTTPDNTVFSVDPTYNVFDDWGSTMSSPPSRPDWLPNTPPGAAKNRDLVTTITAGAGTTTLTLAAAAGNTVAAATVKHDNAPNFLAAFTAVYGSSAVSGRVYIPASRNQGQVFVLNSTLDLVNNVPGSSGVFSIVQQGIIVANETLIFPNVKWEGLANPTSGGGNFAWEYQIQVAGNTAWPMIYTNQRADVHHVTFIENSCTNQCLIFYVDGQAPIPASQFSHDIFALGGSDYVGQGLVIRNNINASADYAFDFINFTGGPGVGDESPSPMFMETQGIGPVSMDHIMMNHRGIYLGAPVQGTMDNVYCQGCIMPHVTLTNSNAGNYGVNLYIRNMIVDTSNNPFTAYFDNINGQLKFFGSNSGNILVGSCCLSAEFGGAGAYNQNSNIDYMIGIGTVIDGVNGTSPTSVPMKYINADVGIGSTGKVFVSSQPSAGPTCSVSAGGSVGVNTYSFVSVPVFGDGGEGQSSQASASCTTSPGNQTITVSWPQVTGAIGYDIYYNGGGGYFSFQCSPVWTTALSFVWTNQSPCNQGLGARSSGPSTMTATRVATPQITLPATTQGNNGGSSTLTMPSGTAARNHYLPDATGTILLDSQMNGAVSPPAEWFDNFTAGLGSNYTNTQNSIVLSGGQFTGGTNSQWNSANLTATGLNFNADQYSGFILTTTSVPNAQVMTCVRLQAGVLSGYCAGINTSSHTFFMQKFTGGGPSVMASAGITEAVGDYFVIQVVSNLVSARRIQNGVVVNTLGPNGDGTYTSGFPGIVVYSNTSMGDNFEAGNLYPLARTTQEQDWNNIQHFLTGFTLGNPLSTPLITTIGNSGRVGQTSGTLTNGNLAKFDANGNIVDSAIVATTVTKTIASGTATLGTGAITSGACATVVTVSATGVATTDVITATFNSDPSVITGYAPSASGSLYVSSYPTTNNVNFNVCNSTGGSITPSAATLNWRVVR